MIRCFSFLWQKIQCVNLSEIVLESFPDNDNLNAKSIGLFGPGKTLCKILSRPPEELELVVLVACIMFHKIR